MSATLDKTKCKSFPLAFYLEELPEDQQTPTSLSSSGQIWQTSRSAESSSIRAVLSTSCMPALSRPYSSTSAI
ncbi:hypothetical protein A2U01_0089938 [Trifolium medium]|uniref:Uncharacterized protein n=1 Tax=Trifolium medium TaxID=97028 RepID=A0A392U790_9FABA|nr:hypothetical protein [Trifolium medium]